MIQLIALEIAVLERLQPILGLLRKAEILSIQEYIYKFRLAHLVEGSFSPASSILTQLAKGQKDNRLYHSLANIHWSEDKDIIYYTGLPVELSKIGAIGRSMTQELMQLIDLLVFKQELPIVELSKVVDSIVQTQQFRRSNYNFIKYRDNQYLDVKYLYNLAQACLATGDLQILKQTENRELAWIDYRKHWYLTIERQFLCKLIVLVYITARQPSYRPELGSIKVYNSQYSTRNIMVLNSRVAIITIYNKARKRRGNTKYIL